MYGPSSATTGGGDIDEQIRCAAPGLARRGHGGAMLLRMKERLHGKTAVLTAAAQGIGRATALAFAAEGARVLATDVNADALRELEGSDNLRIRPLDVTDPDAIALLAQGVEAPDILFNCAGYVHHGTVLDCSEDDWSFTMELNVRSMYPHDPRVSPGDDRSRRRYAIVNVASVASSLRGFPFRFAYGTSKAAVIGLDEIRRGGFRFRSGIRCNCICPGTVQTPSLDERIAAFGIAAFDDPVQARKDFIRATTPRTSRYRRGDRGDGRLSRRGRIRLRHGCDDGRRRRNHDVASRQAPVSRDP